MFGRLLKNIKKKSLRRKSPMKTNQKIPEEWSVKKLGEICKNKGQYGANAPAVPYSPNLPLYIRITDIDDEGKYISSNRVSVDIPDYKNYLLKMEILFLHEQEQQPEKHIYMIKQMDSLSLQAF